MVVKRIRTVLCGCGETIKLYEYIGLEGARYTDHHCDIVLIDCCTNPLHKELQMNPKVFFLRDERGHRVACVVSTLHKEGDKTFVHYSVSTHDPKDRFDRETAKTVAIGRLTNGKFSSLKLEQGASVKGVILNHLVKRNETKGVGIHPRTVLAAQLWLATAEAAAKVAAAQAAEQATEPETV